MKREYEAFTQDQKDQADFLIKKWSIRKSEAIRLVLGEVSITEVLDRYDLRPDGSTIHRTFRRTPDSTDALSKRLPGSFGSKK